MVPCASSQDPAQRNSSDFVAAWATRASTPPVTAPVPAATRTKPSWAHVEAASSCLRSRWARATVPMTTAVTAPTQATGVSQPVAASSGCTRSSRYPPAATMVAECSRAEAGDGPSMAPDSQPLNGSCADLPSAATTIPATATWAQPRPTAVGATWSRPRPPPARAAPTAT